MVFFLTASLGSLTSLSIVALSFMPDVRISTTQKTSTRVSEVYFGIVEKRDL